MGELKTINDWCKEYKVVIEVEGDLPEEIMNKAVTILLTRESFEYLLNHGYYK